MRHRIIAQHAHPGARLHAAEAEPIEIAIPRTAGQLDLAHQAPRVVPVATHRRRPGQETQERRPARCDTRLARITRRQEGVAVLAVFGVADPDRAVEDIDLLVHRQRRAIAGPTWWTTHDAGACAGHHIGAEGFVKSTGAAMRRAVGPGQALGLHEFDMFTHSPMVRPLPPYRQPPPLPPRPMDPEHE